MPTLLPRRMFLDRAHGSTVERTLDADAVSAAGHHVSVVVLAVPNILLPPVLRSSSRVAVHLVAIMTLWIGFAHPRGDVLDMKTHRLFFAGMLTAALLTPNACSKDDTTLANTPLPQETTATAGTLTVKFDYTHYPTLATG